MDSAISRMAALPLPLSLIPGPSGTESRWAPTTTVRSARPPGESAITLLVSVGVMRVEVATRTVTGPDCVWPYSSAPTAKSVPITGMVGRPRECSRSARPRAVRRRVAPRAHGRGHSTLK